MAIDKIIIDFDHTLFDTTGLKRDLAETMAIFGINPEIFWKTYPENKSYLADEKGYSIERHLSILQKETSFDLRAVKSKMDKVISGAKKYLFPDATDFLSAMADLKMPLFLLSRGEPNFQNAKILATGITGYFQKIYLTPNKKTSVLTELVKKNQVTFFINDQVEETKEVIKEFAGIKPILKQRPDIGAQEYARIGILNFHSLNEIKNYLTAYATK